MSAGRRAAACRTAACRPRGRDGARIAGTITGGSCGIGPACARRRLARGARVLLMARGEEELRHAPDRLGAALSHVADVGDAAATATAVSEAAAALPHLERERGTLVVVGSIAGRVPAGPSPTQGRLPSRPSLLVSTRDRLLRGRGA